MRYGELLFLGLLVAYHAFLLVNRRRRPFASNYLIFLAGMALAWNLGLEGLRWQTLPGVALLLIDLAVLGPSFRTLRGRLTAPGFFGFLGALGRSLVSSVGLVLAVAIAVLSVAFPLPSVELTGGLPPAYRVIRFPSQGDRPGLELKIWYPASGPTTPRPRPGADPETWQRQAAEGSVPAFWQAYREHLPTNLIVGGRPASPGTRYPVVYVALPAGERAEDLGYLFEDLASRGSFVVAGGPLPPPLPVPPAFRWDQAAQDLARPWQDLSLWTAPEARQPASGAVADFHWLEPTRLALQQLAGEPGDPFFGAFDPSREALWVLGRGAPADLKSRGFKAVLRFGAGAAEPPVDVPELVVAGQIEPPAPLRWTLQLAGLYRTDYSDAAYLKPYLVLAGLKRQADGGVHGALRQYQAAFLQAVLWDRRPETFSASVPQVPGILLTGR